MTGKTVLRVNWCFSDWRFSKWSTAWRFQFYCSLMLVSIIIINSHIPVMFEENSVKLLSWIPLTNLEYCCSYRPLGNRIQEDPEHFKIAYITFKAFEFQYVVDALSFLLSSLNFLASKKFPENFFSPYPSKLLIITLQNVDTEKFTLVVLRLLYERKMLASQYFYWSLTVLYLEKKKMANRLNKIFCKA